MKKIRIREARRDEIGTIVNLSDEILRWLENSGITDYFGGVNEAEVSMTMLSPSKVLVAVYEEDGKQEIVGFTLLQVPNYDEIRKFQKEFEKSIVTMNSLVINSYGVKPEFQGRGIANLMMENVKFYAFSTGHRFLIGTIHPENEGSKKTMMSISNKFRTSKPYEYHMKDGRNLVRQNFCMDLM